jgi:hypothetical protein
MNNLPAEWLAAKEAERVAIETRRNLEDQMVALLGIPGTLDGTSSQELDGYEVKIVGRMNRKVDGEALQDLARESGLEQYLTTLFKWDPELRLAPWKATAKEITDKLASAITTTPGRPSFSVSKKEEKEAQ